MVNTNNITASKSGSAAVCSAVDHQLEHEEKQVDAQYDRETELHYIRIYCIPAAGEDGFNKLINLCFLLLSASSILTLLPPKAVLVSDAGSGTTHTPTQYMDIAAFC